MKFNLIIGNPPYNDSKDSKFKKNGANAGGANFYKKFIDKANIQIKDDGIIAFITPPGAFKSFYKNNLYINGQYFNHINTFGKNIATVTYFAGKNNKKINIDNIQNKFIEFDKNRLTTKSTRNGYFVYSYIKPTKIISFDEWSKLSKKDQSDKYRNSFELSQCDLNKKNLEFLLNFFSGYLNNYGAMWSSFNKKIKYQWLEGLTYEINNIHIQNFYGFNDEEMKIFTL